MLACFKASSAILNTLLKVLNERRFDRGDGVERPVPLRLCVAASNEWPDPEHARELGALFDRFLFRKEVKPVRTRDGLRRLLFARDHSPRLTDRLDVTELAAATAEAKALPFPPAAAEAYLELLAELARDGVRPGDRRKYQCVDAVKATAYLAGADRVEAEHLEVCRHVLWDDPASADRVHRAVVKVANPPGMRLAQLMGEAADVADAVPPGDFSAAAKAAAKLSELIDQIRLVREGPKRDAAEAYAVARRKELRLAAVK